MWQGGSDFFFPISYFFSKYLKPKLTGERHYPFFLPLEFLGENCMCLLGVMVFLACTQLLTTPDLVVLQNRLSVCSGTTCKEVRNSNS